MWGGNCLGTHRYTQRHAPPENTARSAPARSPSAAVLPPSVWAAPDGAEPSERV